MTLWYNGLSCCWGSLCFLFWSASSSPGSSTSNPGSRWWPKQLGSCYLCGRMWWRSTFLVLCCLSPGCCKAFGEWTRDRISISLSLYLFCLSNRLKWINIFKIFISLTSSAVFQVVSGDCVFQAISPFHLSCQMLVCRLVHSIVLSWDAYKCLILPHVWFLLLEICVSCRHTNLYQSS